MSSTCPAFAQWVCNAQYWHHLQWHVDTLFPGLQHVGLSGFLFAIRWLCVCVSHSTFHSIWGLSSGTFRLNGVVWHCVVLAWLSWSIPFLTFSPGWLLSKARLFISSQWFKSLPEWLSFKRELEGISRHKRGGEPGQPRETWLFVVVCRSLAQMFTLFLICEAFQWFFQCDINAWLLPHDLVLILSQWLKSTQVIPKWLSFYMKRVENVAHHGRRDKKGQPGLRGLCVLAWRIFCPGVCSPTDLRGVFMVLPLRFYCMTTGQINTIYLLRLSFDLA